MTIEIFNQILNNPICPICESKLVPDNHSLPSSFPAIYWECYKTNPIVHQCTLWDRPEEPSINIEMLGYKCIYFFSLNFTDNTLYMSINYEDPENHPTITIPIPDDFSFTYEYLENQLKLLKVFQ